MYKRHDTSAGRPWPNAATRHPGCVCSTADVPAAAPSDDDANKSVASAADAEAEAVARPKLQLSCFSGSVTIVGAPYTACTICGGAGATSDCERWAAAGECDANPGYMLRSCRSSCQSCAPCGAVDAQSLLVSLRLSLIHI